MGRKNTVPYALYRVHGYVNASLAQQTGFTDDDLELLKESLGMMFEHDRSAARGQIVPRRCIAFRHETALGNVRADQLFDLVTPKPKRAATIREEAGGDLPPPRTIEDYSIDINQDARPEGITIEEWI